ncbi:MAG: hypothetical protein ACXWV1_02680 [Chitinophagaceae bacterium]
MATRKAYKKYFIRQYSFTEYSHGGIGYADAETILEKEGFLPVAFPCHVQFSIKAKLVRLFFLMKTFFSIRGKAIVVFIFPAYAGMTKLLLWLLRLKPGIRIICFIGDIDGIKDGDKEKLDSEIKLLNHYRYFIVHNAAMQQWVQQHIPGAKTAAINFFDFLARPFEGSRSISGTVVFAGNLGKSLFLEKLGELEQSSPAIRFVLYGPGCTGLMRSQKNADWLGVEEPHQLPLKLDGSFGLLWDGDSINEPGGSLGDYMRYISHHKASLYILGGLPLIVPATAGTAPLVESYKIGFTIKSLYEIEDKIRKITSEEYQQMKKNMQPLAEKISKGGCIKEALQKLMPEIWGGQ